MLAPLDNEIIFKKAFTDPFVLTRFVKDILGIDFDPGRIETEKKFSPKIANIDFAYDIFAESKDHRVVVELQRVEYDYHFDRFLHYHYAAVIELQASAKEYKIEQKVFTVVVLTEPYVVKGADGFPVKDDVLISSADPVNLQGKTRNLFGHQLIFLNPNYISSDTPTNYRDWLSLFFESIHNPKSYQLNLDNTAVRKVVDIIDYDNISGEMVVTMKNSEGRKAKQAFLLNVIDEQAKALEQKDKALEHAATLLAQRAGMTLQEARISLGLPFDTIAL